MIHITQGDARKPPLLCHASGTASAHLVYCDPPSNRGMNEGASSDRLSDLEYQQFAFDWLTPTVYRLRYHGWFILCTYQHQRSMYERIIAKSFSQLVLDHEVIWAYNFGLYIITKFVPSHDNILFFKYGKPRFYPGEIRVESQRQRVCDPRADPRGRVPGSVWHIPRVPGNAKDRAFIHSHRRTCQPQKLCERILRATTLPNHIVYDPFVGSGSMALVAKLNRRNYYGIDICSEYIDEARARLEHEWEDKFCSL